MEFRRIILIDAGTCPENLPGRGTEGQICRRNIATNLPTRTLICRQKMQICKKNGNYPINSTNLPKGLYNTNLPTNRTSLPTNAQICREKSDFEGVTYP